MADKEVLKKKFSTGQVPTGEDFAQLIDTVGKPGADGFPTEEDWNALLDRVEALENAE